MAQTQSPEGSMKENVMFEKKRVAIVGSGISGLAAIKSCLEEGLEPTCFEQNESIGNGNTSGDMATGMAPFAEKVFYSVGSGMWVIPRITRNGTPPDNILYTRANFKSMAKLDKLVYDICNDGIGVGRAGYFPSNAPMKSRLCVNDVLQFYTMYGKIKIHGHLVRLGPREAEFDDGSVVQNIDTVLFATGYQLSLDFVNEEIVEATGKLSLYKQVFPLHLPHTTLALVGCQVINASNPVILELKGRLAARVFSGNHKLPPRQAWMKDIDDRNNMVFAQYGRYKYMLPLFPLHDQLASELGVTPSWFDLIRAGPKLAYNYLYGPVFPYQNRLWGPHPWSGARRAIEEALEHRYFGRQPRKSSPPNLKKRSKLLSGLLFLVVSAASVAAIYRYTRDGRILTFSK